MTQQASRSTLLNRDRLTMANKGNVAAQTVGIFDRLQGHPVKEEQLLALSAAFVIYCEAARINAGELFTYIKNLMVDEKHADQRDHRFAAMKFHTESYLLRGV